MTRRFPSEISLWWDAPDCVWRWYVCAEHNTRYTRVGKSMWYWLAVRLARRDYNDLLRHRALDIRNAAREFKIVDYKPEEAV